MKLPPLDIVASGFWPFPWLPTPVSWRLRLRPFAFLLTWNFALLQAFDQSQNNLAMLTAALYFKSKVQIVEWQNSVGLSSGAGTPKGYQMVSILGWRRRKRRFSQVGWCSWWSKWRCQGGWTHAEKICRSIAACSGRLSLANGRGCVIFNRFSSANA